MTRVGWAAVTWCVLCACVTEAPPKPKMRVEDAFAQPSSTASTPAPVKGARVPLGQSTPGPREPLDKWAKAFRRPVDCAAGAREYEASYGHDTGWNALKACVARGDFTLLPELLSWATDVSARPEGPSLVAQVVGARGGAIDEDAPRAQAKGVTVLSVDQVLRAPKTSVGKLMLVVGKVGARASRPSKREVLVVSELRLGAPADSAVSKGAEPRGWSSSSSSSFKSAGGRTYVVRPSSDASSSSSHRGSSVYAPNELVETGREVRVTLQQATPLLQDEQRLFLLRVDSVREEHPEELAIVVQTISATLVGHYEVHPERY